MGRGIRDFLSFGRIFDLFYCESIGYNIEPEYDAFIKISIMTPHNWLLPTRRETNHSIGICDFCAYLL